MTTEDIRQVIVGILRRIAPDEDLSNINDEVPFRDQMELDSMDFLDIVMELRKQYRIQIPEEEYERLTTMQRPSQRCSPKGERILMAGTAMSLSMMTRLPKMPRRRIRSTTC